MFRRSYKLRHKTISRLLSRLCWTQEIPHWVFLIIDSVILRILLNHKKELHLFKLVGITIPNTI